MAKVISTLFISADGVAEIDPDWHFPYFDDNMGRAVGEDYDTADVLLIGQRDLRQLRWSVARPRGGGRRRRPVRQATRRRAQGGRLAPAAGVLLAQFRADQGRSPRCRHLAQGRCGHRGILIPGSISVVQRLLAAGLVDELRLLVHPVAARRPQAVQRRRCAVPPEGDGDEAFPTGVIRVIYSPAGPPAKAGYDEAKDKAPGGKSPPCDVRCGRETCRPARKGGSRGRGRGRASRSSRCTCEHRDRPGH